MAYDSYGSEVSSSVKLMLLQGQLAETVSAAASAPAAERAPAPRAPARAAELAVALAAMKGDIHLLVPYPAILNYFDVKSGVVLTHTQILVKTFGQLWIVYVGLNGMKWSTRRVGNRASG